jgi:hypothetical protein
MLYVKKKYAWIMIHLLTFILTVPPVVAKSGNDLLTVDANHFELFGDQHNYSLQYGKDERLIIPLEWLIPPDEVQEDDQSYVSSFDYDKHVTSFQIGDGRIGLHLSSYKIQEGGSANAAAGRDVFLVFDPINTNLYRGGLKLGITKSRVRSMGCPFATFYFFVIGDINHDGLIDIGATKEEVWCEWRYDEEKDIDKLFGPFYEKRPIQWYIYSDAHWKYEPSFKGQYPHTNYLTLPLINLAKSPVDFIREIYGERLKNVPPAERQEHILRKQTVVFRYADFGPQVIAYELIGFNWYQWDCSGCGDLRKQHDIRIVVYRNINLSKVKELYPIVIGETDYRYVEYNESVNFLNGKIVELTNSLKDDRENSDLYLSLKNTLEKTRNKIIHALDYD